jgi:hypothetical protein
MFPKSEKQNIVCRRAKLTCASPPRGAHVTVEEAMASLKAARCDDVRRLASLALDSAARRVACVGEERSEFQEQILTTLRTEAEAETSIASLTSHRCVPYSLLRRHVSLLYCTRLVANGLSNTAHSCRALVHIYAMLCTLVLQSSIQRFFPPTTTLKGTHLTQPRRHPPIPSRTQAGRDGRPAGGPDHALLRRRGGAVQGECS